MATTSDEVGRRFTIQLPTGVGRPRLPKNIRLMEWTTEQPTQLGYYWALNKRHERMTVGLSIVEVAEHAFMGQVKTMAYDLGQACELSDFSHWLGPLPVPELPNESSR